jgi:formylglycine-generating enzyme required for sulfatase activity
VTAQRRPPAGQDSILDVGGLPAALQRTFLLPARPNDQHGNRIITRGGRRFDPATSFPYEIWFKEPRIEFVLVLPGEFTMGDGRPGAPEHLVHVTRGFYLSKYEITQGQWKAIMRRGPWERLLEIEQHDRHPASYVAWVEALSFVRRLSKLYRQTFRLPTEAEWEYACRAGSGDPYCYGAAVTDLAAYAWFDDNQWDRGQTSPHPVGRKSPNAWGLFDMHGNVWEWCEDWYGPYPATHASDPTGPDRGYTKVYRGGGFCDTHICSRASYRASLAPGERRPYVGLRLLLPLP